MKIRKKEKKKKEKILKNIEEINSIDTENYFEREKINLMKNYLVLKRRVFISDLKMKN